MGSWCIADRQIDTSGLFSIFPNHTGMRMKYIYEWVAAASKRRDNILDKRRSPRWGLFHATLTSAWGTGCLKPECRQIGPQTQDDSREFTEEEHQFEVALRIRACRGVCSKMGHAPFGGEKKVTHAFTKPLRAETLDSLLLKGSSLTKLTKCWQNSPLLTNWGIFSEMQRF